MDSDDLSPFNLHSLENTLKNYDNKALCVLVGASCDVGGHKTSRLGGDGRGKSVTKS